MNTQEFYDRAPTSYLMVKFLLTAIGASLLFLACLTIILELIARFWLLQD
ncbi:hypothetical protein Patl1_06146 [Pistacia atlantica]|uniref:Uncharacterized protein n=1 Tax=Pistacia atlantica TaxID=434234 RepID=A0ACC1BUG6_9ROSI|nr:hypothetical protein Patl1_06146 [Pistacia atlantica]